VDALTGDITTVAGGGTFGNCPFPPTEACIGNGGPATSAVISPQALAVDGSGNIFEADDFGEIREIVAATGNIQDVAGSFALAGRDSGDGGPATSAALAFPTGVALDAAGNIFIADNSNSNIREVDAMTGIITTVAGSPTGIPGFGGDGGPATAALLQFPFGVWVDASDNIFISDASNNRIREVVAATGLIQTVAGNGTEGFSGDGGPATAAQISRGASLLRGDTHGNIFYADFFGNTIREFRVGGNINTVAGNQVEGFTGDGGAPTSAELNSPNSVSVDAAGRLLIADLENFRVRQVTLNPTTTAIMSSPNPSTLGQSVTFTATVTSTSPGTPSGTVTFFASAASIGPQPVPTGTAVLNPQGIATFTTAGPAAGTFSITADYSGDTAFAGSTSAALTQTVNKASDMTPPVTMAVLSPAPNMAGWNSANVTVTLNSTDNELGGTGVKQIQWALAGAQAGSSTVPGSTTTVTISAEGITNLTYFGTDNAGNIETAKSITTKIDKTPPVTTVSASPSVLWPPNGGMVKVTVSGTMADSLSGVDSRTPSFVVTDAYGIVQPSGPVSLASNGTYSFTISLEARRDGQDENGRLYTIVVSAQDNAGNVGSSTTTVIVPHDQGN
jgi:hypothetical protein